MVMCLLYRSFPELHSHPQTATRLQEQKSHLLPAEHPKRSPGWGCFGMLGGCLLFQQAASYGTVKIRPFCSCHFLPTVGAYLYSYSYCFFFSKSSGFIWCLRPSGGASEKSSAKHVPADQSGSLEPVEANQDSVLLSRQL